MIHVMCTGPESSGTRLLTRLVSRLGVEATHKSIPNGMNWWEQPEDITHIIAIVRDPFITEISSQEAGHPSHWSGIEATFPYRITEAWATLIDNVRKADVPWIPLTYEGLTLRPQWTMNNVADFLGVSRKLVTEKIADPRKNIR